MKNISIYLNSGKKLTFALNEDERTAFVYWLLSSKESNIYEIQQGQEDNKITYIIYKDRVEYSIY